MSAIGRIIKKAGTSKKTIVLNESSDPRVLQAAKQAAESGIAHIIMAGNEQAVKERLHGFASAGLTVIDPDLYSKTAVYAQKLYELRKHKGVSREEADRLIRNPLYFSMVMVANGDADGMVTGAATASAEVLRAAFQIIKCRPDVSMASNCQLMDLTHSPFIEAKVWALADCVVNVSPTAEQLAGIAVAAAHTYRQLIEDEPKVAMLSFSTKGSAHHALVDKVAAAAALAKQSAPELLIDGELQFDAAVIESVGRFKCPDSLVAGRANVLVFPDLQSGNIGYKIVERVGGGKLIGSVIQGLNRPVNDLSRGCNAEDIFNTVAMTAVQAQLSE